MTDTKQLNKQDPLIWLDDAPDKHEGGWKNMFFLNSGSALIGDIVFHSEMEANSYYERESRTGDGWGPFLSHGSCRVLHEQISHVIPVPVKEKP